MSANTPTHYKETQYGFEYGAAKVERVASLPKSCVVIAVRGKKNHDIDVYVTKTGQIRVFKGSKELK